MPEGYKQALLDLIAASAEFAIDRWTPEKGRTLKVEAIISQHVYDRLAADHYSRGEANP